MSRAMNFNAGPATLPLPALERAQQELLDIEGSGMSVLEHSHRGKLFMAIHEQALALVRELMAVPDEYDVLLLQGGASLQFAMVPMNLLGPGQSADYVITGTWAKKAYGEAKLVGSARVAATTESGGKYARVPKAAELDLDANAAYLHITTNNTIAGTQFFEYPDSGSVPLVADMSSDIMWRPTDISKFGLIYAGAQKNIGPSGLVLVIVRRDLVEKGRTDIPAILRYATHSKEASLFNTPPTFSVYLLRNVLELVKANGGVAALELHNRKKAKVLYDAIERRPDVYRCPVDADSRSLMNVVFNLPSEDLEARFIAEAGKQGMVGIKGHRSVGGVRVSIYNAARLDWVEALAQFMDGFKA